MVRATARPRDSDLVAIKICFCKKLRKALINHVMDREHCAASQVMWQQILRVKQIQVSGPAFDREANRNSNQGTGKANQPRLEPRLGDRAVVAFSLLRDIENIVDIIPIEE